MMMVSISTGVVALLVFSLGVGAAQEADCSRVCTFSVGEDLTQCAVLGAQPGNLGGQLILWAAATQPCLDSIKVAVNALPLSQLKAMFPSSDGAGGSVTAYASFLKNGDTTVAQGLRVGWPAVFDGTGKLRDSVTLGAAATTTACKPDASACWSAFRTLLTSDAAARTHMQQDGVTLWNAFRKDRELEQSVARINVCAASLGVDSADAERRAQIAACPELKAQIDALSTTLFKDARINGAVQCSSFGIGPESRKCDSSAVVPPTVAGPAFASSKATPAPGADNVRLGAGIGLASGVAAIAAAGVVAWKRKRPATGQRPPAATA